MEKGSTDKLHQFMETELGKRTMAAVVVAPPVLIALYTGGWAFGLMMMVAALVMHREWKQMWSIPQVPEIINAVIMVMALYLAATGRYDDSVNVAFIGMLANLVLMGRTDGMKPMVPIGFFYIFFPCFAIFWLRNEAGLAVTFWLILSVWATDIGAYFAGKKYGKHKVWPALSPNKTWEGVIGGAIAATLVTLLLVYVFKMKLMWGAPFYAPFITVVSQAGDFFESWLKRKAGVKDSGTIMPGHGGLLDRVDGLLPAAVFMAIVFSVLESFGVLVWVN